MRTLIVKLLDAIIWLFKPRYFVVRSKEEAESLQMLGGKLHKIPNSPLGRGR